MPDDSSSPKPVNPPGTPSILDKMKGFLFGGDTLSNAASGGGGSTPDKSTITPAEKVDSSDVAKRNEDYMNQKKAAAEKSAPKVLPKTAAPKAALKMSSKGGKR